MAVMKKFAIAAICIVAAACTVYFVYFRHPPAASILDNNKSNDMLRQIRNVDDDYSYEEDDYEEGDVTPESAKKKWERWIKKHGHVSIGELYNKCEGNDKIMVGKTILVEDKKNGGVTSYTHANATWEKEVTDGELFIDVKYNGKDLYNNHWDLCHVEDDNEKDRIIFCPIKAGRQNIIKNIKIPIYIPKGEYVTKVWATNQDNEILACGFSKFVL
ncbi:putative phosphatidylglycerol/phosphatidylinositol transfer protein DDB_G0282179 [Lineus longissimus]|uniref:putative phosphatidylglycerol/phosphatidylinositol transfer protein DDB_G0282179 n=1 Tax=Lineus longissimus TaxID=88925 RepID=UPI002B4F07A4